MLPLKLGLFLLAGQFPGMTQGEALGGAVECALAAERADLASVWIAEHHFISYGVCPSAVAFAANVLGRTSRIAVGTAVCILSSRHPVALAEEAALLDHLSGRRFSLGVGRGGPWVDLEVFGTGLARYERGFGESLDLLLAALQQERVGGGSDFFEFREVPVVPRPATRPRPPVAVAATTTATVELAAARGLPLILGMHATDDEKAAMLTHYATVATRHGRDPHRMEHVAAAVCHVADTRGEAMSRLRATMPAWIAGGTGEYVNLVPPSRPRREPAAYVEHLLAIHPVGPPEYCAERLAATAERTGIRHFLLMVEGAGDLRRSLDTVERLSAEVVPLLTRYSAVANRLG